MLDSYRDLIDELLETPSLVRAHVAAQPGEDVVSLIEVLRKRDQQVLRRIREMKDATNEPNLSVLPEFDATIAKPLVEIPSATELLAQFETARGDLVSFLMNLSLKDWECQATYDGGGFISLADEIDNHVAFDESFRDRLGLPEHR